MDPTFLGSLGSIHNIFDGASIIGPLLLNRQGRDGARLLSQGSPHSAGNQGQPRVSRQLQHVLRHGFQWPNGDLFVILPGDLQPLINQAAPLWCCGGLVLGWAEEGLVLHGIHDLQQEPGHLLGHPVLLHGGMHLACWRGGQLCGSCRGQGQEGL